MRLPESHTYEACPVCTSSLPHGAHSLVEEKEGGHANHTEGLLWWSVVKTLHSNAWGAGSIPGWGDKIPRGSQAKETKNIKQKQ